MAVIIPEQHEKSVARAWNDTGPTPSNSNSSSSRSSESASPVPPSEGHNSETLLIRCICRFFKWWSYFIAKNAVAVIIVCSILSLIGAIKLATTPNENDIVGWTPYGARSLQEMEVSRQFFGHSAQIIGVMLLILGKDGGSMLTAKRLNESKRIEEFVSTNFTIINRLNGDRENFRQFCFSFCQLNDPLVEFANGFAIQSDRMETGDILNDRVELHYPVTSMYGRPFNIQNALFGLEFYGNSSEETNSTALGPRRISNLKAAKMVALHFRGEHSSGWSLNDIKEYELAITHYFKNEYKSDDVEVYTLSTSYVEAEVVRAGYKMLPIFVIGFGIMLAVSSCTTFISAAYMQQLSIHKFSLALFACICPFMASGTALGFLFLGGVRFGSILCISPFLVLAIGVDDAYLMIHAWQRASKRLRSHPVQEDCAAFRLAEVLTDTGPAIIISALTNILADTVGMFTGCPEITLLSYGNMACIGVDFLYQISFYAAIMVIAGQFEIDSERQKKNKLSIEIGDDKSVDITNRECCPKVAEKFHDSVKTRFNAFLDGYVNLVNNKVFDAFVFLAWAAYIALCVYGISGIKVNISSRKLFAEDSDLQVMEKLRYEHVYSNYIITQVFVNNPGNLSDPIRLQRLNDFVAEFESLPGAWGRVSSNYFVRDFLDFEEFLKEREAEEEDVDGNSTETSLNSDKTALFNENDLPAFIAWPEYQFWRGFIRTSKDSNNHTHLDRFFFTTAFHGVEFLEWKTRSIAMHQWRDLVDEYKAEFNASVFYDEAIYIDFMDNMPTDTWQSAAGTLGCMALICFVFMYDFFTVIVATAAIASVMCGILGINALLGMELDPIVMACLVISVGFSVDIPAHVSYHFHMADAHLGPPVTVKRRLRFCLASVGFPAVQAAISTNLCVVALLFADIYTSRVFVRIMVLCVSLCLLHGLLIIPCAMSLLSPIIDSMRRSRK